MPGFAHAPGGQLIQATDQWVGVRGARLVLIDEEGVRAPVVAAWLRQLGHEAYVLEGGIAAAAALTWRRPHDAAPTAPDLAPIAPREVAARRAGRHRCQVIDLRAEHDLPQGPHRRRPSGRSGPASPRRSPTARRQSCWSPTSPGLRSWPRSTSAEAASPTSACSTAATRPGAPPACRSRRRPTIPPMPIASTSCSSPPPATTATTAAARAYLTWEIGLIAAARRAGARAFRICSRRSASLRTRRATSP